MSIDPRRAEIGRFFGFQEKDLTSEEVPDYFNNPSLLGFMCEYVSFWDGCVEILHDRKWAENACGWHGPFRATISFYGSSDLLTSHGASLSEAMASAFLLFIQRKP